MTETLLTYEQCLDRILKAARVNRHNSGIQYAAIYANAGYGMTGETQRVQILYIQSNLATYRGDEAKQVKASLKEIAKTLK